MLVTVLGRPTHRASVLLKHVEVMRAIDNASRKVEKAAQIDAEFVLRGLAREAQSTADDANAGTRIKALELLGKTQRLFVELSETGKPGAFESLPDEELDARIDELTKEANAVD